MNRIITASILVLFVFAGCGEKKTEYKIPTKETITKGSTPGVTFVAKKLSKSLNDCNPRDSDCSYIRLNYQEATSGTGKDKINSLFNTMLMAAYAKEKDLDNPQQVMDLFIKDCREFKKQNPKKEWMLDFNARVYAETDKLYSFIFENASYSGNPPPKIITLFKTVNKETGDEVTLVDLLNPGFADRLNAALEKKYREWRQLSPADDLQEKGDLFTKTITFTHNFAVTKEKGMEFYYNTGEIMPAIFGPILIKLEPIEVTGLLYGESLLR